MKAFIKKIMYLVRYILVTLTVAALIVLGIEGVVRAGLFLKLGSEGYAKYKCVHDSVFKNLILNEQAGELNSLGLRGPEINPIKDENTYRIAVIGGSAVFGVCIEEDKTWPRRLEKHLQDMAGDKKIEVLNAGRLGSVAANEVFMVEYLLKLQPDMIIVYNGWNDIYHARYLPDQYKYVGKWADEKLTFWRRFSWTIRRYFLFIQRLREWRKELKAKRRGQIKEETVKEVAQAPETNVQQVEAEDAGGENAEQEVWINFGWQGGHVNYPLSSLPPPNEEFVPIYRKNLERIAILLRQNDVDGIFIFQPDLGYKKAYVGLSEEEEEIFRQSVRTFSKDWYGTVQVLYPVAIESMREVAEEWNLPFYDFSLILNDTAQLAFGDTVHLTVYGYDEVGRKIAEIVYVNYLKE